MIIVETKCLSLVFCCFIKILKHERIKSVLIVSMVHILVSLRHIQLELIPVASNSMGDSRGDVGEVVFVVDSESTLEMSIDSSKPGRIF